MKDGRWNSQKNFNQTLCAQDEQDGWLSALAESLDSWRILNVLFSKNGRKNEKNGMGKEKNKQSIELNSSVRRMGKFDHESNSFFFCPSISLNSLLYRANSF